MCDADHTTAWPPPEQHDRAEIMLLEIIMTQHWDMAACPCWICTEGRILGCRPREKYLRRVTRASVHVDSETWAYKAYRRDTTAPPPVSTRGTTPKQGIKNTSRTPSRSVTPS